MFQASDNHPRFFGAPARSHPTGFANYKHFMTGYQEDSPSSYRQIVADYP